MRSSAISLRGETRWLCYRRFRRIRIELREERFTAGLPRDSHKSSTFEVGPGIDVRGQTAAQIIPVDARLSVTTVAVAVEHPAFIVERDFVKIEKVAVAILAAAALLPNAGMVLN